MAVFMFFNNKNRNFQAVMLYFGDISYSTATTISLINRNL